MKNENCNAFIMGFCPNEEFYIDSVTIKCPLPHVSDERENYKNQIELLPFETEVLKTYKRILMEIDKKIEIKTKMLKENIVDESHYDALIKCQQIIDCKSIEFEDFTAIHSLLIIHGKLILDFLDDEKNVMKNFKVCKNCSSYFKNDRCNHIFCSKYKNLRNIVEKLDKRVHTVTFKPMQ